MVAKSAGSPDFTCSSITRDESLIIAGFVAVRMSSRSGVVVTAVAGTNSSSTLKTESLVMRLPNAVMNNTMGRRNTAAMTSAARGHAHAFRISTAGEVTVATTGAVVADCV